MSLNIIANSRAYVALLAALPGLGVTVAEGQTALQAIQARLASAPATPVAPSAEAIASATVTLLVAAGIPVATGQSPDAAIKAFLAEFEQAGNDLTTAQASLVTARKELTAAQAQLSLYTGALAKAGIKITAADSAKGVTAADIDAALAARISTKAAEQLSQTGTPQVDTQPAAAAGSEAAKPQATAGKELEAVAAIYAKRRGAK